MWPALFGAVERSSSRRAEGDPWSWQPGALAISARAVSARGGDRGQAAGVWRQSEKAGPAAVDQEPFALHHLPLFGT